MLEAVKLVVSIVSSGDENSFKEYIHPRAGLVGALGKYSRVGVAKPLVYVTEVVAFMARLGTVEARKIGKDNKESYAFRVSALGDVTFEETRVL